MGITQDKQGIREEFTSKGFDVSRLHAAFITATKLFEDNQDHGKSLQALMSDIKGLDLANLLGGRRALTSAAATMQTSTAAEKRAKQDAEDWAFYLNLIQDGQVGHYIAGEIFDKKTDWEIFEIVAEIEAATGNSFENYARSILGEDNVPERFDGENNAEYQRRVLKAIAVEILDPHTGQIKPQYADDPVAKIVAREEPYQRTVAKTAEIEGRYERGEITLEQATQEIREDVKDHFSVGDVHASKAENSEIIKTAKKTQDVVRDAEIAKTTQKDSDDGFVGFASTSTKSEIKVDAPAGKAFKTAVVDTTEQEQNPPEIKPNDFILKS